MKTKLIIIITLFLGASIFVGCNKNEESSKPYHPKTFDIKSVNNANSSERNIAIDFIQTNKELISKFFKNNHYLKSEKVYSTIKVIKYTNLHGKAIIINYNTGKKNTVLKKSDEISDTVNAVMLLVSDSNQVMGNIEYNKIAVGDFYFVKTQANGIDWFTAKVNKKTKKISNLKFYNMKTSLSKAKPTFAECAKTAIEACVGDGMCAFECGIVWEYCLPAIGLACLYVSL